MDPTAPLDSRLSSLALLPYQRRALLSPHRFTWNNWSRQTGKSHTFTLRRLLRGLFRRRNQLLLSAGQRQSRELMLKLRLHCEHLGIACKINGRRFYRRTAFTKLEARLPGGIRIIALPANPLTARGFTADVFLDEFAMHRDDRAIWAALLPTLMRDDGELDIASTPRGSGNMFHRLGENPCFSTHTLTLPDAIAQGLNANESEVRSAMDDERLYRQEFLCQFDDDEDSLLSHDRILACVDAALCKSIDNARLADANARLYLGIDVGRLRDLTVVWLWQREGESFLTRGLLELPRTSFDEQFRVIAALLAHRSIRRAAIDATGIGMQLAESLVQRFGDHRVEAITFTAPVQDELASRLRSLATRDRLRIPSDADIHNDWHSVKRIVTASGHVRYRADRTALGHSDRFWAAALGLQAAADAADAPRELLTSDRLSFFQDGMW